MGFSVVEYNVPAGFSPPPRLHRQTREHAAVCILEGELRYWFTRATQSPSRARWSGCHSAAGTDGPTSATIRVDCWRSSLPPASSSISWTWGLRWWQREAITLRWAPQSDACVSSTATRNIRTDLRRQRRRQLEGTRSPDARAPERVSGRNRHGGDSWGAYCLDLPGVGVVGDARADVDQLIREAISFHLDGLR